MSTRKMITDHDLALYSCVGLCSLCGLETKTDYTGALSSLIPWLMGMSSFSLSLHDDPTVAKLREDLATVRNRISIIPRLLKGVCDQLASGVSADEVLHEDPVILYATGTALLSIVNSWHRSRSFLRSAVRFSWIVSSAPALEQAQIDFLSSVATDTVGRDLGAQMDLLTGILARDLRNDLRKRIYPAVSIDPEGQYGSILPLDKPGVEYPVMIYQLR